MRIIDKLSRWDTGYELALTPNIEAFPTPYPIKKECTTNSGAVSVTISVDFERGYSGVGPAVFERSIVCN